MLRVRKGIDYCHAIPSKPSMEIFRQQHSASAGGGGGKHDCVPNSDVMVNRKFRGRKQDQGRCLDQRKGILPRQNAFKRSLRLPLGLANQYVEEFAQHLNRHKRSLGWKPLNYIECCLPSRSAIDSLRIDQHVSVKSNSHDYSYSSSRLQGPMSVMGCPRSRFKSLARESAPSLAPFLTGARRATGRPWLVTTKLCPSRTSRSNCGNFRLASAAEIAFSIAVSK